MSRRTSKASAHSFPVLPTARFDCNKLLGEGAFASIYRATDKATKKAVAIKMIKKKASVPSLSEYLIGRMLQHPNIISTIDCIDTRDHSFVILELANGGDLFGKLDPHTAGLDEATSRKYALQLAEAVAYMHTKNIVHSDIKPENVLIHNNSVKLCDFGLAGYARTEKNGPAMGTGAYMAQELMSKKSKKSIYSLETPQDVWSFAIVLYAILFADLPWEKARPSDADFALFLSEGGVTKSLFPFNTLSRPMRQLMSVMLAIKPEERCTMEDVVGVLSKDFPWFKASGSPKQDRKERIAPTLVACEEDDEDDKYVLTRGCDSTISMSSVASIASLRTPSQASDEDMSTRIGSIACNM